MFRKIFKFYPRRNFFNSPVWKESKKEVTKTPQQEAQNAPQGAQTTPQESASTSGVFKIDFAPNELEKFILVYSGKYKSKAEIPERISYSTIDTAKSKVRIKLANYLMLGTVLLCGYYVWLGKKKAKAGESIVSRGIEDQRRILEKAGIKRD